MSDDTMTLHEPFKIGECIWAKFDGYAVTIRRDKAGFDVRHSDLVYLEPVEMVNLLNFLLQAVRHRVSRP